MKQGELFKSVCEESSNTLSSDVNLTVNTSTEETGQKHTDTCKKCGSDLTDDNWPESWKKIGLHRCKGCSKESNDKSNDRRMYVNGKYVPQTHPLYKAGRYKSFDDAAFSSLVNYKSSKEGQVYIIVNPAWPDWVKIGMAVDAEDRCNGYQTSSPMRDYKLVYTVDTKDRRKTEALAHKQASKVAERRGEWFKMSVGQAKECIQHGL